MNFEYKVGYLWKYHEEDPGLQSWNRKNFIKPPGRNVEFARADWSTFDQPTWKVRPDLLEILKLLLETCGAHFWTGQPLNISFSSFPFVFHFLSLVLSFPQLFSIAPCWILHFRGLRVPGSENLKLGSCPDRPRALPTSAGRCVPRFLLNWKANFCIFKFVSSSPHLFLVKVGMIYT